MNIFYYIAKRDYEGLKKYISDSAFALHECNIRSQNGFMGHLKPSAILQEYNRLSRYGSMSSQMPWEYALQTNDPIAFGIIIHAMFEANLDTYKKMGEEIGRATLSHGINYAAMFEALNNKVSIELYGQTLIDFFMTICNSLQNNEGGSVLKIKNIITWLMTVDNVDAIYMHLGTIFKKLLDLKIPEEVIEQFLRDFDLYPIFRTSSSMQQEPSSHTFQAIGSLM